MTLRGEEAYHAEFTERERHEIALESRSLPPDARLYVIHRRFKQAERRLREEAESSQARLF